MDELTKESHIIEKFRDMVNKRYQYDELKKRFNLPSNINEEVIDDVKEYFLGTIYPDFAERQRLEAAFGNLANYMKQPRKIWGLFGNMTTAVFKFGRHFFQAFKAGLASLDSFLGAKKFEQNMAAIANKNNIHPPISDEEYEKCYHLMQKSEIEKFIHDIKSLFGAMVNTPLLLKTLEILDNVVETMKKKPHIYPQDDIDGILLGRSLLNRGYELFSKYDEDTKQKMVEVIYQNELWYMNYIFERKDFK
ncbi:MAG: hypothetical protein M9887_03565 [Chitinophagales bacterium]|nr:hypothetical protein [Chitinophagales bacterium]